MNNNKWAIFSDVDGTIYPFPDKTLSDVTKNKIRWLKTQNIPFVLNTGNPPLAKIQRLAEQLDIQYLCCSNGAMIYDNLAKKPVHIEIMDTNEASKVFPLALEAGVILYYMGTDQYYLYGNNEPYRKFLTEFNEYNDWIDDGTIPNDLHKIEAYGTEEQLKHFYQLVLDANLNFEISNVLNKYIEITSVGISKGSALKWMCQNVFNIDPKNVMAIGDSANDISMFKQTDFSYVMDNSDPKTKSVAKFYTSDVRQNGIVEAIDDYLYRSDYDLYLKNLEQQQIQRRKQTKAQKDAKMQSFSGKLRKKIRNTSLKVKSFFRKLFRIKKARQ
ncbi:Cof-type HAD-IIB family hydrolase [Mycoplasma nasistruthionis]|uniref:HAD family phosphatase n=1 Tax=Mycoplasma nasistruthionis TaxID=353852 RepID=A0A4Y6I6D2_9MOLU|nr:HAD family hydrolase [Mycoplasma nasistruthionis]QDF64749.1 HAD family phosphatase [Mycoplasma nasistruthionis]